MKISTKDLALTIVFASLYAALVYINIPLSYSSFQFRIAGVLRPAIGKKWILAFGYAIGVVAANVFSPFGAFDLVFMPIVSLIAGIAGREGSDQWIYLTKISEDIFSQPVYTNKFRVSSTSSTASSFAVRAISRYGTDSFVLAGQAGTGSSAKMLIFVADAEGMQVTGKEMITSATGIQVAYDVISDETDEIIAVGKNSFENNSMISFFKIRF